MLGCTHVYTFIPSCHAGLNVTEVAHDMQQQVARYVTVQLGVVNSFDTWHGMINALLHIILYSFEFSFVSFIRDEECGQRNEEDHRGAGEEQGHHLVSKPY